MKRIAIYGKGGIGKSTTTSNLSAALATQGYRVMQIGCDPKADSVKNLMGGKHIPTVLNQLKLKGDELGLQDIVYEGYKGVLCVESGGPTPGIGCAGRGIISAFEKLEELRAFEEYKPDIVIYDVLGDVVCGGFAMPIRGGYAKDVFIVSSGEMMALYAATNIASAISNFGKRGYASLRGIILNAKNIEDERQIVEKACDEIGTTIINYIPRSPEIQTAEHRGGTVFEFLDSTSMMQSVYLELANQIVANSEDIIGDYI
ncbi:MAG: nitrogenase iron protein [Epulopiscium sp. Nele67-Bin002]|nr:MAG: nitrogenase iron protein [Epulopiscium sp. Nuni2H_MBin001]OON91730.1 MAG: nitrogenase iron protein [Epulopiscium sp. Nele67-Bin002]